MGLSHPTLLRLAEPVLTVLTESGFCPGNSAATEMMLIHAAATYTEHLPENKLEMTRQKIADLRSQLLSQDIEFDILGLDDPQPFENLPAPTAPTEPSELKLLQGLEPKFRERLEELLSGDPIDLSKAIDLADDATFWFR